MSIRIAFFVLAAYILSLVYALPVHENSVRFGVHALRGARNVRVATRVPNVVHIARMVHKNRRNAGASHATRTS